jgi:hypothetical protein
VAEGGGARRGGGQFKGELNEGWIVFVEIIFVIFYYVFSRTLVKKYVCQAAKKKITIVEY